MKNIKNQLLRVREKFLVTLMLVALLIISNNTYAAEEETGIFPDPLTPEDIIVSGNKKSKTSFIKKLVIHCAKQGKNTIFIKQCLEGQQIYKNIEVSVNSNNKLDVKLKDRWTAIGLPTFSEGGENEEKSAGFFVIDLNAWGVGDFISLSYNRETPSNRDSYDLTYVFQNVGPNLDKAVGFSISSGDIGYDQFSGTDTVYGAEGKSSSLGISIESAGLQYSIGYESVELTENFIIENVKEPDETTDNPDNLADELVSYEKFSLGFGYGVGRLKGGSYYASGFSFGQTLVNDSYRFRENSERDEESKGEEPREEGAENDLKLSTNFYLGVPSLKNQVFQLYLTHAIREQNNVYGSYQIGGEPGARGIPGGGLWGREYATLAMEYQIPVVQKKKFIMTLAPFIDVGNMNDVPTLNNVVDELPDSIAWSATGMVMYFYFDSLLFPMFSMSYAQNSEFYTNGVTNIPF